MLRLKFTRIAFGYTQGEGSNGMPVAGINADVLRLIENGRLRPTEKQGAALAGFFKIPIDHLLEEIVDPYSVVAPRQ